MLYDMTDGSLTKVAGTTFKDEKVLERTHLQAAVRDHIEVLGDDLLVVAEEFGEFEDTHRRIDLLCVDRSARLDYLWIWRLGLTPISSNVMNMPTEASDHRLAFVAVQIRQ